MSSFFPTDVRIKLSRDSDVELLGQARHVLFHALHLQDKGAALPITVFDRRQDGTQFSAQITAATKTVSIYTPPPTPPVVETPPPAVVEGQRAGRAGTMISGWTRGYAVTSGALYSFHPTNNCADAYNIGYDWQPSTKLATTPVQVELVKPSMFSGTMKRVVQAMLGMGIVRDDSPLYFAGPIPAPRQTKVTYGYRWNRTHGIYKAGPKNHWLVEISQERGILAMPLPLLGNTGTPKFRSRVRSRDDRGTLLVLDEFGALPSGEDFPATGAPLENAITAGKVLRLMPASGLADYFGNGRQPYYSECGWAFSESGVKAHNTVLRWGAPDDKSFVHPYYSPYGVAPVSPSATVYGEYWGIDIELSEHDVGAPVIGVGSARIEMFHSGKLDPWQLTNMFYPDYANPDKKNRWHKRVTLSGSIGTIESFEYGGSLYPYYLVTETGPVRSTLIERAEREGWGAYVHVHFNGETPERVKWIYTANTSRRLIGFVGDQAPLTPSSLPWEMLYLPSYCRDGYLLSDSRYASASPHVGRFSVVGTVSIVRAHNNLPENVFYPPDFLQHPFHYYVNSYGRFDAVINAGPDAQYMMSNGPRGAAPFATPSAFEFLRDGIAGGLENTHPYEFNCVGGHPKGTT